MGGALQPDVYVDAQNPLRHEAQWMPGGQGHPGMVSEFDRNLHGGIPRTDDHHPPPCERPGRR
ncbi:hypothetical protein ACQPZP_04840 [Spirillospora sp. CA-142024]|uniref:hypothetical protein n=1 Tax=Spirillospora sp. CA-142024 TaxID=3240036 RepID=UPI003D8C7220